jgi:hypothetical protein
MIWPLRWGSEVPDRVARVNQFWREGGAENSPFNFQSGRQPFPWETNPSATAPNQLFAQRSPVANYGPGAITGTVGLGEMGLGASWLADARQQEESAREAIRKSGTTPANVQALEDARAAVAQAEFMWRMGMGTISGGGVGELESRITRSKLRPSVQKAEAERGRMDTLLNPQPNRGGGGGPTPPPGPRTIPPPTAGGPPHQPGVTRYRNPTTGDERFLDRRGRWQDNTGFSRPPDPTWDRISAREAPSSMAEFLMG